MGHPQEGGSTVGGVRRLTTRPGFGEQHGSEVSSKNEVANNVFSNDSRLVHLKGSVLLQRWDTKRSVAVQTVDSVTRTPCGMGSRPPQRRRRPPRRQHQKRCSRDAPLNTNTRWNSRDSTVAFSGLWTLSCSNCGTESGLSERPQPELQRGLEHIPERPRNHTDLLPAVTPPRQYAAGLEDERGGLTTGNAVAQSENLLLRQTG